MHLLVVSTKGVKPKEGRHEGVEKSAHCDVAAQLLGCAGGFCWRV
jgi:hypothetical protein